MKRLFLRMRLFLTFVIVVVTAVKVQASSSSSVDYAQLQGVVVSSEDGLPLPYATVYIDGTTIGTSTDEKGRYLLRVAEGNHTVVATYVGFESASKKVSRGQGGVVALDFLIKPSPVAIEDVVVKSKSELRELKELGFAVSSVNTQKAMLSSANTDEIINNLPGVKIRQSGGLGSDMKYAINGLSDNSVRVYIDGVSINNYGRNFTVSSIPPSLIERVDVFKGVVPAYLADDALGGAINVVLKENTMSVFNSSYSYGSYNTHKVDANGQFRTKKRGVTAGVSAYYNSSDNDYEVWGRNVIYVTDMSNFQNSDVVARRFHDSYESYGVAANVGVSRRRWADRLRGDIRYSAINKDIQHGASMEVVYGQRRTEQSSLVANIDYKKRDILPRLNIAIRGSYSHSKRLLIDTCSYVYGWHGEVYMRNGVPLLWTKGGGEGGAASLESNFENNIVGRVNLDYALDRRKRHKITLNAMYTHFNRNVEDPYLSQLEQMLTETRIINKVTSSVSYDTKLLDDKLGGSLFYKLFMQEATLVDPIVVDGQTIGQSYSNDILNGGYGATLSYSFTPKIVVTFSGERAVRLPSFTELLGDVSNSVEASIDLDPEQSTNLNLGGAIGAIPLGSSRRTDIQINANLFYRNVSNLIEKSVVNQNDDLYGYENIGKVLSKGVDGEVTINHRTSNGLLTIAANSGYADARFNLRYNEVGVEYDQYNNRMRNQPYLTAGGEVSYSIHRLFNSLGSISFKYNTNYTHQFYVNWECYGSSNKAVVPTQFTHDLGVVYTFPSKRYFVSFDMKNIFNEQVFDNYALQKPGRWISAKVSCRLF